MNKKISYGCLIFCMALYSIDTFAARRNTTRANLTTKTRSSSLVSGYSNKYFKSPSITLVEKRSVELEPLMFTENIANIKKTLSGSTAVDSKYRLCIPCENIYLTYNDGVINESLKGDSQGEGNCYSLEADTNVDYYKLAVKLGAIEACGDKLRMTILDMRNKDVHTEVDSVVLNIVPNSSLYDYSNIKLGQDTEFYDLIKNYKDAKNEAIKACKKSDILSDLKKLKNLLIGSTAVSAVATVTGGVDTVIQTANTIKSKSPSKDDDSVKNDKKSPGEENANSPSEGENSSSTPGETANLSEGEGGSTPNEEKKVSGGKPKKNLTDTQKASITLSSVSAAGNLTTMGLSIGVASQVNGIIDDIKACKTAAEKMHAAGMALEAGLEEITSADE